MISIMIQNFFKRIQSGEIKLEEAKKQQKIFKLNLNETSRRRFTSGERKITLEIYKLFHESREAVIKLFNDYSSIIFEAKRKGKYKEGLKILTSKHK